jgi:hypothetical protein
VVFCCRGGLFRPACRAGPGGQLRRNLFGPGLAGRTVGGTWIGTTAEPGAERRAERGTTAEFPTVRGIGTKAEPPALLPGVSSPGVVLPVAVGVVLPDVLTGVSGRSSPERSKPGICRGGVGAGKLNGCKHCDIGVAGDRGT